MTSTALKHLNDRLFIGRTPDQITVRAGSTTTPTAPISQSAHSTGTTGANA